MLGLFMVETLSLSCFSFLRDICFYISLAGPSSPPRPFFFTLFSLLPSIFHHDPFPICLSSPLFFSFNILPLPSLPIHPFIQFIHSFLHPSFLPFLLSPSSSLLPFSPSSHFFSFNILPLPPLPINLPISSLSYPPSPLPAPILPSIHHKNRQNS